MTGSRQAGRWGSANQAGFSAGRYPAGATAAHGVRRGSGDPAQGKAGGGAVQADPSTGSASGRGATPRAGRTSEREGARPTGGGAPSGSVAGPGEVGSRS